MSLNTRRAFPRYHYEAPIMYSPSDSDCYGKARVLNFSRWGIYLEPEYPLIPDSDVRIIMVNYAPGTYGPDAYKFYFGKIRWCREMQNRDTQRFGVGVQITKKSHTILEDPAEDTLCACDLCSKVLSSSHIRQIEDSVCLCEDCHTYFQTISNGQIRRSITRFMTGNVI